MDTLYSQSQGRDDRVESEQQSPHRLTSQDLQAPDDLPSQSGCAYQESGTAERLAAAGSLSPPSSNTRVRDKIVCFVLRENPVRYAVRYRVSCSVLLFVHVLTTDISPSCICIMFITSVAVNKMILLQSVLKDVNVPCTEIFVC